MKFRQRLSEDWMDIGWKLGGDQMEVRWLLERDEIRRARSLSK